jgi:hypothetical protein
MYIMNQAQRLWFGNRMTARSSVMGSSKLDDRQKLERVR